MNKGTILIIDDNLESKVSNQFIDYLKAEGYHIEIAKDLSEADGKLSFLLDSKDLDGIILDFSIPGGDKEWDRVGDKYCGPYLYFKHRGEITRQSIPIIVNTTADDKTKREQFEVNDIERDLSIPVYDARCEYGDLSLTHPSVNMRKTIIEMFNNRDSVRVTNNNVKEYSKSWGMGGKTIYNGIYAHEGD